MRWQRPILENFIHTDNIDWQIFDIERTLEKIMEYFKYWHNQQKLLQENIEWFENQKKRKKGGKPPILVWNI